MGHTLTEEQKAGYRTRILGFCFVNLPIYALLALSRYLSQTSTQARSSVVSYPTAMVIPPTEDLPNPSGTY